MTAAARSYAEVLERAAALADKAPVRDVAHEALLMADAAQLRALAALPLTTQLDTARAEMQRFREERDAVTQEAEQMRQDIYRAVRWLVNAEINDKHCAHYAWVALQNYEAAAIAQRGGEGS